MPGNHIVEEEIFTHEYLWRSSSALAELVDADEEANHHLIIPALVMTLMAFEAFVNFCGFVLLPDRWANEREEFRGKGGPEVIPLATDVHGVMRVGNTRVTLDTVIAAFTECGIGCWRAVPTLYPPPCNQSSKSLWSEATEGAKRDDAV